MADTKKQATCGKCHYHGEPAFDAKCPRCGEGMKMETDYNQKDTEIQAQDEPKDKQDPTQEDKDSTSACPSCSESVPQGYGFCSHCGTELNVPTTVESKECSFCGLTLKLDESFCSRCGTASATLPEGDVEDLGDVDLEDDDSEETNECVICGGEFFSGKCVECGHHSFEENQFEECDPSYVREVISLVSKATIASDDKSIRDLANSIVWGNQE